MPNDPFYKTAVWREVRAAVIMRDGSRCRSCGRQVTGWAFVDHVVSRRKAPERALDPGNLRTLCRRCHNAKSARADGGFGNEASPRRDSGGVDASGRPRNPEHLWSQNDVEPK